MNKEITQVKLVSKTIGVGLYENLSNEEIIAAVARHGVIKEDNGKLVKYLMDHRHLSPLQHVYFSFKIVTSRAISAQAFRHASLDFQETSQRYEEINSVIFPELRKQHKNNRQSSTEQFNPVLKKSGKLASDRINILLEEIDQVYKELIEEGTAKECARMILPMCSATTIHISGNFRNLLAFLNVRCDSHAQKEIQYIASCMGLELENEMPSIMGAIDWRNGMFL